MFVGGTGEAAGPAAAQDDAGQGGGDHVTHPLPEVETFVGVSPHTVNTVGAVGLGEDLLEIDL